MSHILQPSENLILIKSGTDARRIRLPGKDGFLSDVLYSHGNIGPGAYTESSDVRDISVYRIILSVERLTAAITAETEQIQADFLIHNGKFLEHLRRNTAEFLNIRKSPHILQYNILVLFLWGIGIAESAGACVDILSVLEETMLRIKAPSLSVFHICSPAGYPNRKSPVLRSGCFSSFLYAHLTTAS